MKDYKHIAEKTLEYVGGKENVSNIYHCMTRLRFELKDKKAVNETELNKTEGVLGLNWDQSGELQVIIGLDVDHVYQELTEMGGFEVHEVINENLDEKKGLTMKSVFDSIVGTFSACMNPLVPIFVLLGTFNVVAALIGPAFLKLVTEESNLYKNFYYVGQTIIYFLPVLIAVTGSKHFKTNTYISLVLACLLIYPSITEALEAGYMVYGIPATNAVYSSSLLPMILILWVQSYVEKLVKRIIPASLNVLLVPFCIVAIMLPLEFCVLGPLGTIIGGILANGVVWLNQVAGPLETMLAAAVMPFTTAFGIGRPIFFICMSMLFANGVEYAYMPMAMCTNNFVVAGIALGYLLKAKKVEEKQLGATCTVSVLLGGVSEPTLFGIVIPNKI